MDDARNVLSAMRLEPKCRQQLQLLMQRQHLEEEELRLRHYMELEKFQKNLDLSKYSKTVARINLIQYKALSHNYLSLLVITAQNHHSISLKTQYLDP